MADCVGAGFPQFPCALVQMRYSIGENGYGQILMGDNSSDKKGKAEERGKRWGICIRQVAIQVETRIKEKKKFKFNAQ